MKKIILLAIIIFSFSLSATIVFAQGLGGADGPLKAVAGKANVGDPGLENIIGSGINAALSLVGIIFLILMVYAGYLWMTARGEEETIKKSQKIIISTIIGLVIVLSAYAITSFVTGRF
ncbi:MAG: hypothetical protein ABIJ23_02945 [Candidatus Magasanikbacteria bacterium]